MTTKKLPFLLKFQSVIDDAENLSAMSKTQYKSRLNKLTDITGHDVDWIIKNCKKTMELIEKAKKTEPQTQKSYINAILAVFRYTQDLKVKHAKHHQCWTDEFKRVNDLTHEKYENLEASPRQLQAYLPWEEIVSKMNSLDKDSVEYFLLSLYTMIPPSRADFNNVKIYYKAPTETLVKEQPNYLVITPKLMKLVFNEFKSKGAKIQTYENVLPDELVDVINNSLKTNPRDYLVISPRNGKHYANAHSYTVYVDRIFNKIFQKPVTINTLRHSFVNHLDFNTLTPSEKQHIANQMMHSVATMDRYRLIIPAKATKTKKDKVCSISCVNV
jgi:hypothetical protein